MLTCTIFRNQINLMYTLETVKDPFGFFYSNPKRFQEVLYERRKFKRNFRLHLSLHFAFLSLFGVPFETNCELLKCILFHLEKNYKYKRFFFPRRISCFSKLPVLILRLGSSNNIVPFQNRKRLFKYRKKIDILNTLWKYRLRLRVVLDRMEHPFFWRKIKSSRQKGNTRIFYLEILVERVIFLSYFLSVLFFRALL